ncbi:hypothetical protein [Corynebacterium matruchotii]|uniref:hypothetical protein n=1 Tax=Corynebacterium matruchotii TaxID=43768 RepID=UPI0028EE8ACC|nr:hypothetical protein [Corynebacterium matruchotii]
MSKSVFAGKATQRALAGLTSLALVAGGLTVVPSVAGAQEIKECNGSFVGPKNLGLEDSNLALKKNTYWPGDVLEISAENLELLKNPYLTLNGNAMTGVAWPEDQDYGEGLTVDGNKLIIKDVDDQGHAKEGIIRVKAVLPSLEDGLFTGKNVLTLSGTDDNNDEHVTLSRSVDFWVNESGHEGDPCSYTLQQEETPTPEEPEDPANPSTEPSVKPSEPTAKPSEPTTKPTEPGKPTTKPSESTKPTEPGKPSESTKPTTEPGKPGDGNGKSDFNKFFGSLKDNTKGILFAVAAAIGIPAIIAGVVGLLAQQGMIPKEWLQGFKF